MLGRKEYTQEELDHARAAVDEQLAAYADLADAVAASGDPKTLAALERLEPVLFNNLVLTIDRYFVHRFRSVTGKEGTPANEVELLTESLMNNGGVFRGNNVVKYRPDSSVLQLKPGDRITLTADSFRRLADAYLADIEAKFR